LIVDRCLFNQSRDLRNTRPADAKAILGEPALRNRRRMTTTDGALLYVDDDDLIRELVAIILEEAGFVVVVAAHGAAAYRVLDRKIERSVRMVITDINLGGGLDGWAVAQRARELDNAVPVIYVTGAHGREWQSKAVPNSIMIQKPFTAVQLVDTISALLESSDPPLARAKSYHLSELRANT
jgi:DNA-binding response OmpR family regulator